jgi:uncharacterized protein
MSRVSIKPKPKPELATPFVATAEGLRVRVRVTPKARMARIEGFSSDGHGRVQIELAVTAAPEDGKANAAVLALLANEWRLPKSTLAVASGAGHRNKVISIDGDGKTLMASLLDWSAGRGRSGRDRSGGA